MSDESAYLPDGHDAAHDPESKYFVSGERLPPAGHVRHEVLLEPLHVRQLESQAVHRAPLVVTSTNTSVDGHCDTQLPLCKNGFSSDVQLTHCELDGPLHVPHAALHGWQTALSSAYLPTGRQDAKQVPGAS